MPYIESEHSKAMPASPKPANLKGIQLAVPVLEASGFQSSRESLAHLESLLSADVVDLCEVCDVICALPQLESLIIRLGQSVVPGTGLKPLTVAEAAVLLGTDRLRAIVHAWPSIEPGMQQESRVESRLNGGSPGGPPGGAPGGPPSGSIGCLSVNQSDISAAGAASVPQLCNPETLYFATIAKQNALPSSGPQESRDGDASRRGFQAHQIEDLAESFVREFANLAPLIEPVASAFRTQSTIATSPRTLSRVRD